MNWSSHGFLILSKFFIGYGAGFTAVLGYGNSLPVESVSLLNLLVYPTISGMIMVFPQLTKTFAEASRDRLK